MTFVVVYDACALFGDTHRDVLIRIAQRGLVQAKWSDQILDEMCRAVVSRRPELADRMPRTRELMCRAVRDCLVTGHLPLVDAVAGLPDPDDRHVVAAAIKARAQVIVTNNLDDFPEAALAPWGIQPRHPDEFVVDQHDLYPDDVEGIFRDLVAAKRKPPRTLTDILDWLAANEWPQAAAHLREALT